MKGFPDLPPIWLAGFCVLAWVLSRVLPVALVGGALLTLFAAIFVAVGFAVIVWSGLWFMRKKTTIEPHHDPSALIVEGPYRLSRNPIYLGMVSILLGVVLAYGAVSAILLPGLFAAIITRRFIIPEEAALVAQFGDEARRYIEATRRWL